MSFNPTFGKVTTHDYNTFCILACQLLNLISFWRDETVAVPTTTSKGVAPDLGPAQNCSGYHGWFGSFPQAPL